MVIKHKDIVKAFMVTPYIQMLANYQMGEKTVEKGNSAYLRIIKIETDKNCISVKVYSPWLNEY